jgi:hypothetical protein
MTMPGVVVQIAIQEHGIGMCLRHRRLQGKAL